jgi:hypothetical protein
LRQHKTLKIHARTLGKRLSIALADHLAEILGLGVEQVNEGQQVGGVSARWLTDKSP